MTAPVASPPVVINIVLPEKINDKHIEAAKAFAELAKRPAMPQDAHVKPQSNKKVEENCTSLSNYPRLAKVLERLTYAANQMRNATQALLKVIAYPALIVGGLLLAVGLSQIIILVATTLSAVAIMESQALVFVALGGIMFKIGQDTLDGNDLNTVLGNLLYLPIPFLLHKAAKA